MGTFSPLLIGESSATTDCYNRYFALATAFSPLLIGESSATRRDTAAARARRGRRLSVPSSSGNLLRHHVPSVDKKKEAPLSVPSSSGNLLRLWERDVRCVGHQAFSPLLIGESSATQPRPNWRPTPLFFQSPPHRGIFCDTKDPAVMVDVLFAFQSPPHRGIFCDKMSSPRKLISVPPPFSPLLIGESSATASSFMYFDDVMLGFQSPPHRGIFCDGITLGLCTGIHTGLSVPSSSGNLLRLATIICAKLQENYHFQSPPHRGIFCDLMLTEWRHRRRQSFSPLLIGESSATAIDRAAWSHARAFSPLLIGESSATWIEVSHQPGTVNTYLSVPSSSGNLLRLVR